MASQSQAQTHWRLLFTPVSVLYSLLYLAACFYTVQATMVNDTPYIDLHGWVHGQSKLPYQKRDLIAPILRAAEESPRLQAKATGQKGLGIFAEAINYPLFVINLVSLVLCGVLTTLIYWRSSSGLLWWLPSSVLLVYFIVSVSLRWEHRYLFPYDLLAMFFFTLGVFCITRGWAWLLVPLMPLATLNRETTIMWVPLLALYGWHLYRGVDLPRAVVRTRLIQLGAVAVILLAIWVLVVHHQAGLYANNDRSEAYPRFTKNLHAMLTLKGVIETVSAFGFTLPFLLLYGRRVANPMLRSFLPIFPLWVAVLFYQGEIVESRVFAELFPLAAVVGVLIFEATYRPVRIEDSVLSAAR